MVSGTLLLFAESNSSCMLTMVVSKTVSIHFQTYSHPTLCGGEPYSPKASIVGDSGAGSVTPPESGAERSKHAGMSAGVREPVMFKLRRIINFLGTTMNLIVSSTTLMRQRPTARQHHTILNGTRDKSTCFLMTENAITSRLLRQPARCKGKRISGRKSTSPTSAATLFPRPGSNTAAHHVGRSL